MTYLTLSVTAFGSILKLVFAGVDWALTLSGAVLYDITQKKNEYKCYYERAHQTIRFFDKLFRKRLEDKVFDIREFDSCVSFITRTENENKKDCFGERMWSTDLPTLVSNLLT